MTPAERGSKVYGSQFGPLASAAHCHLVLPGFRIKDLLLLNLPPQPRESGDHPVWERDTPAAPVRTRRAAGRLDLLTWPGRRIRLRPDADGHVDAVAHHDGDRLEESWPTTRRLAP